jgi:hypothetical protein
MNFRIKNGKLVPMGTKARKIGNIAEGEQDDDVVTKRQLSDGGFDGTFEDVVINNTLTTTGASTLTGGATFGAANSYYSRTSLTALAGGAQAGTALSSEFNDFTTVATALDSAQLPTAALGAIRIVKNSAAKPMAVFGQTGATIDGNSANASVVVAPNETIIFRGISATAWKTSVGTLNIASGIITEQTTLTATEIVGTAAGDLGHANGAALIAGVSSAYAMEFVSAVLIYDFDTAAYTGGADDLVVCISGGGATLSGATTAANLLGAAGDKIVAVYPLTTAGNPLSVGTGISLKSTAWTQPGTAAGVLRCQVAYRLHRTNL